MIVYRKDLVKIARQIENYIKRNHLKSIVESAKLCVALNPIVYIIEENEYNPEAVDVLINAYKEYMRIAYPGIYQDKKLIKLIDKLSMAIQKE